MLTDEVRVLGRFAPSELDPATIDAEIRPLLPPCCRRVSISVRTPQPPQAGNLAWHQDDDGPRGTTRHMVVWANMQPTEIRRSDGSIVTTNAGDLIWLDNGRAFHRQPSDSDQTRRWFVAVRCSGDQGS